MTERLHFHLSLSCIGEGNGNPLQCSCLENPRDGGAWWAAVYGVAQSRTRLKWFSSSSWAVYPTLQTLILTLQSYQARYSPVFLSHPWSSPAKAVSSCFSVALCFSPCHCEQPRFFLFFLFSLVYTLIENRAVETKQNKTRINRRKKLVPCQISRTCPWAKFGLLILNLCYL